MAMSLVLPQVPVSVSGMCCFIVKQRATSEQSRAHSAQQVLKFYKLHLFIYIGTDVYTHIIFTLMLMSRFTFTFMFMCTFTSTFVFMCMFMIMFKVMFTHVYMQKMYKNYGEW